MADHWFRIYNTVRHDRKIRKLSDQVFRSWIMLLSLASEENGKIPQDFEDLAMELHLSVGKTKDVIQILLSAGLIERLEENGYIPHKWEDRQFKSDTSTPRVKRFRERKRNGFVTAPETEQNRTEHTIHGFDEFWLSYPRKENKVSALKAFEEASKIADPIFIAKAAASFAASYRRKGSDEKFMVGPVRWLEERAWEEHKIIESVYNSPEEIEGQRLARERAYGKAQ